MATVTTGVKMTKAAFKALAVKVDRVEVLEIEIRMTAVEDQPALIAEMRLEDQRESWTEKYLIAGDGAVKL